MAIYTFVCVVGSDVVDGGPEREFNDLNDARAEARALLGKLAAHALSTRDVDMVSVEIFDTAKNPIAELLLTFEDIPK